jgi:hypothetical protein
MRDLEKFIDGLHDYIGKAIAPVMAKIEQVRSVVSEQMVGVSNELAELRAKAEEIEAREPIPGPAPTEDEVRAVAEPVVRGTLAEFVPAAVAAAVEALPPAPTIEELKAAIGEAVQALPIDGLIADKVAALPPAKPGEDGASVTVDEVVAALMPRIEGEVAKWALEFERRAQDTLQRAADKLPIPKNGEDGLGFDDLTMEHDGERKFAFVMTRGEQTKRFEFSVPAVIDRGFWQPGMTVEAGDGVTRGGSYWIAKGDTDSEPAVGNDAWRLAVRKGRDARGGVATPRDPSKPVRISESEA